jgi:K+-sensing histidine kinase KdpD
MIGASLYAHTGVHKSTIVKTVSVVKMEQNRHLFDIFKKKAVKISSKSFGLGLYVISGIIYKYLVKMNDRVDP